MANNVFKDVQDVLRCFLNNIRYDAKWINGQGQILLKLNDRLTQFQNVDSTNNNKLRLFCRQLKRMMDNSICQKAVYHFWDEIYDYINYVLDETDNSKNISKKRLDFEKELEQRHNQFQLVVPMKKSFDEFVEEHKQAIEIYLDKCKHFHSRLELTHVIDNIDDFLRKNYHFKHLPLDKTIQHDLEDKFKSIEIPLTFVNRNLEEKSHIYDQMNKATDVNVDDFLTSNTNELTINRFTTNIAKILPTDRWLVLLGDPANGKTSLLRSIVNLYVNEFYYRYLENNRKQVNSNELNSITIRIPVLIRMGEFASWWKDNQTKQFIDYIGEHTWFANAYCSDNTRNMLKEAIYHGHALILLDGLDEIPEAKDRRTIVDLIKQFIHVHVKDSGFVSAFDQTLFDGFQMKFCIDEVQVPHKPGGNQIIITSRIIGYDTNPLIGTFIKHYLLSVNDELTVKTFANSWMVNVDKYVRKVLFEMGILVDDEKSKSLMQQRIQTVISLCQKDEMTFVDFASLNVICTNIFRSVDEFHPESQIEIYSNVVESAFTFWQKQEPTISRQLIEEFLQNLSIYLHLKSSTGLMDTFNITQLARLIVQQQTMAKINAKLCEAIADKLIKVLQSNTTLVAERGLEVYGFSHLLYQEYFVGQSLVRRFVKSEQNMRQCSIEEIVDRFLFNSMNPRFYNAILLALNWIDWKWSDNDVNEFYTKLVTIHHNYSIPFGAILVFNSFDHRQRSLSNSVVFNALNHIFNSSLSKITKNLFLPFLCQLPENVVRTWMTNYLTNDKSLSKFCQCLLKLFTNDITKSALSIICQQLYTLAQHNIANGFIINQTLQRIMLLARANTDVSLYQWISNGEQEICPSTTNPLILSIVIIVCGGVVFDLISASKIVSWSNQRIYRQSSILTPIIEYITNHNQSHSIKLKTLIEQLTIEVDKVPITDISDHVVDTFVALICLHPMTDLMFIDKYLKYKAFSMAFQRIKYAFFSITRIVDEVPAHGRQRMNTLLTETIQIITNRLQHDNNSTCHFLFEKFSNLWSKNLPSKSNQLPEKELSHLLTFVPMSLQKLYYHLFINRTDPTDSLPLVVLLTQRLMYFEHVNRTHTNFDSHLKELELQCKEHFLDNYLTAILSQSSSTIDKLIHIQCQRISNVEQDKDRDCQLFASSICLARLSLPSSSFTSEIENISHPILQILAWSFVSEIKQTQDFDSKIIRLLNNVQTLPLMTLTFLIIRFSKQRKDFRIIYPIVKMIGETFGRTHVDDEIKDAVFLALKQCGHLDYLVKSFDPTQRNSMFLFRYFNEQTSFQSLNNTLLSLIYITELTFHVHILQTYTNDDSSIQISNLQALFSDEIDTVMTYEAATWITNYLQNSWNESILDEIIEVLFECRTVEEKALITMKQWYTYRYDNKLKVFAQYAALQQQLSKCSNHESDSIEIINEILSNDENIHLNSFLEHIFNSQINDITILTKILERWHKNYYYSSQISIWIRCKTIFDLILKLEFKRIIEQQNKPSEIPFNSLLLIIKGCSHEIQNDINEHLQTFIEQTNEINQQVKEQYVATLIQWIFKCHIWNESNKPFSKQLYNYIFSLLDDHQSNHNLQKAILISLQSVLNELDSNKQHVLITTNAIHHLEKVIDSYERYPNDVLAVCLLAYGIYYDKLINMNITYYVSNQIPNVLRQIFTSKLSEVISCRAALCLIIIEQHDEWLVETPNWFKEKYSLTADNQYNMLLQGTLFGPGARNVFFKALSNQLDDIIDTFLGELNQNLDSKNNENYFCDPSPDYIDIAHRLLEQNSRILHRNSINEQQFKKKLCDCAKYAKSKIDYERIVELYASFGILTDEFSQMLKWGTDRWTHFLFIDFENIKSLSNREITQQLFDLFESLVKNGKFETGRTILKLLVSLGKIDLISLIEIHERISKIIKNLSDNNKVAQWFCKDFVFDELLDLSNVKEEKFTSFRIERYNQKDLSNVNEIDFKFEKICFT